MSYYIKSEDPGRKCVRICEKGRDGQFAAIYGETMESARAVAESVVAELNVPARDTETVFDIINEEIEDMEVRKVQAERDEDLRRREHRVARIEGGIVSLKRLWNRLDEEHGY